MRSSGRARRCPRSAWPVAAPPWTLSRRPRRRCSTWQTLNIGKETTLNFDQSAGGPNNDPVDRLQQDHRSLRHAVANPRKDQRRRPGLHHQPERHHFRRVSQINMRTLVASSLPINDNLIELGLLNNRDAQFLFSALDVPGGSDGTPAFMPPPPLTPNGARRCGGRSGGVIEQRRQHRRQRWPRHARRTQCPERRHHFHAQRADHPRGRPAGWRRGPREGPQSARPRRLGRRVGGYGGTATNNGLIEAATGSALMTGREREPDRRDREHHLGQPERPHRPRIDLLASYGAVGNPNFDNTAAEVPGPALFFQQTGVVTLGPQVSRILPSSTV